LEQQEQNIRIIIHIVVACFVTGFLQSCSSPEETMEDDIVTEMEATDTTIVAQPVQQDTTPPVHKKQKSPTQRFSVQADTVDVQQKKRQGSTASSISVKASAPKKFYTVEVGAFRLNSNVQRHQTELTKRFKLPVRILFDSTINLTRVCVGTFSTKAFAEKFMNKMNKEYPKDYPGLWISYWTK